MGRASLVSRSHPHLLLLALTLLAPSLLSPALAKSGVSYCDNAYNFFPDESRKPGNGEWGSYASSSSFRPGPCIQVSGIGMAVTHRKTIIIVDRNGATNTYATLPEKGNQLAYGQELILGSNKQRGLDVITNTFCSTGQFIADGSLISIGGDYSPSGYLGDGEFSIRSITPCTDQSCKFSIVNRLGRSRWYATSAILADGRVIVVGGSDRGVGLNFAYSNVPYVEYFKPGSPQKKWGEGTYQLQLLSDALPYNLYPFVHLLPSGRVFIFAGDSWVLWDTGANKVIPGRRPKLSTYNGQGKQVFRSYPLSGTSAMFPLSSFNRYRPEIMVCGGASTASLSFSGSNTNAPADNMCYRIFPDVDKPAWTGERMSAPRVMPNAVLLPDGNLLIMNGCKRGYAGLPNVAHGAVLQPDMFNTYRRRWYAGRALATSKVARAYHGSAVLLHDGTVFVSGSNPRDKIVISGDDFPTEFRTEFFYPPYMSSKTFPKVTGAPKDILMKADYKVFFTHPAKDLTLKRIRVVLAHPGFSTHGANHGMRNVLLDTTSLSGAGTYTLGIKGPRDKNVCPPTYYWFFVVVDDVPNQDGLVAFCK